MNTKSEDGYENEDGTGYKDNLLESSKGLAYGLEVDARGAVGSGILSIGLGVDPTTYVEEFREEKADSYTTQLWRQESTGSSLENVACSNGHQAVETTTVKEDGVVNKDFSYTLTETTEHTMINTKSRSSFAISVPFGLETKIGKSATLRLGATSVFYDKVVQIDREKEGPGVATMKREYLNGTSDPVEEYRWDNSHENDDETTTINTRTTLNFGFGYAIDDNISLDLMTSGDLTNIANARISLNIKF